MLLPSHAVSFTLCIASFFPCMASHIVTAMIRVGSISEKNLKAVALELGETLSAEEIKAMIDEFDGDQDGEINAEDFREIMRQSTLS